MIDILENVIGMSYSENEFVFAVCAICYTVVAIVLIDIFAKVVFRK